MCADDFEISGANFVHLIKIAKASSCVLPGVAHAGWVSEVEHGVTRTAERDAAMDVEGMKPLPHSAAAGVDAFAGVRQQHDEAGQVLIHAAQAVIDP